MFRNTSKASLIILLVVLFFATNTATTTSQNILADIEISQIETDEFPQVSVILQTRDEVGKPVLGLGSNDFKILEDGQPVSTPEVSTKEAGIYVHFLIDAGAGLINPSSDPRWNNAKDSIVDFVQSTPWVREGLDTVAVSAVTANGTQQLVAPTSENMPAVVQAVENFSPPGGKGLSGAVDASQEILKKISADPLAAGKAQFIVLLTANFEKGSNKQIDALVNNSVEANIPIYTILLRKTPDRYSTKVRDLSVETNGVYTEFSGNVSLVAAYKEMASYRNQYQIDYISTSSASGIRQVVVNSNIGNGSVQAQKNYSIDIAPPRVVITAPEDGKFVVRTADEFTEQVDAIEPTSQTVTAEVIFPDGYPRRLTSAKLLVDGEVVATATGTRELEFDWDLRVNQKLGTTSHNVAVEVNDMLGLVSTSDEIKVQVKLDIPEEAGLTEEEIQEQIDEKVQGRIDEIEKELLVPCWSASWFDEALCPVERLARVNVVGIVSIIVSIFAIWYVTQSNSKVAVNVRQTAKDVYARVTSRYQRAEAKAYLVVKEGDPNLMGQSIEIYGDTPIGRSREVSEVIFQQNDPNSPISRLHCSILDHENHFKIQDEDSANGTFLNGARMRPLVEEDLRDGDVIELGQIARGGVKIEFKIADEYGSEDDLRQTQATLGQGFSDDDTEYDDF